ncbi:MAG TPA: SMC-Scp complex subunit ScpB [Firmicutes bacterium]|jgi:segregation and condensation protein B|nr:SMC-Scp complex subunit ScpB [Bacillota bacterium]
MTLSEARIVVEGLIFASERPLSADEIAAIIELDVEVVESLVEEIRGCYANGALLIRNVGGGYQVVTKPELAPWIEKLGRPVISAPLTAASTETLAIIAYQQPVTKAEIEQIRGVRSDSALNSLLERELVCELGRKAGPGRPILYGVTENFFSHFGLTSTEELPLKGISEWK